MRLRASALLLLLLAVTTIATTVLADRLYLEGGGVIHADRWWIEGDTLKYENGSGTVGIPRGLVVRIESTAGEPGRPAPAPPAAGSEPSTGSPRIAAEKRQRALEAFRAGKAALEARDYETAASRFLDALRDEPQFVGAMVGHAASEMARGHDGLALSTVLEGLAIAPQDAQLNELLGDLRNREERVEDALAAWNRAFAVAPSDRLREKIIKAERELDAGRYYAFSTTPHFNVRYDAEVDRELASALTDFLEEQFWVLAERFRHTPSQPITVLLYPTREFRDVTQAPDSVSGVYDGKIRVPLGGLRRIDSRARAVLVHELTHAVVHSKTRGNCPRWLHEGLAQMAEGRDLGEADRKQVAGLLENRDPGEWDADGFSYAAALSLVRWLETRRGAYGLLHLLDVLGRGDGVDEALRQVYGADYATLCRGWAAYVASEAQR